MSRPVIVSRLLVRAVTARSDNGLMWCGLIGQGHTAGTNRPLPGDRRSVVRQRGEMFTLAAKPERTVLARNGLNETTRASVVPSDGELFPCTDKHLGCIAAKP